MNGEETFTRLQAMARSFADRHGAAAPTEEYLNRHVLESFLARLSASVYRDDFVIKGGILLGAYGIRRPTRDVDSNAIAATVIPESIAAVAEYLAEIDADDGVSFDSASMSVKVIRGEAQYPGVRLRMGASIGSWRGLFSWDVSAGDPVVPGPRTLVFNRLLGEPLKLLAYSPELTVAEKGVTILERGTASTRWRDYVDIVELGKRGLNKRELLAAARSVAQYRNVALKPIAPLLSGYGYIAQRKWAAWRRKEHLEEGAAELLDDQIAMVSAIIDPIFTTSQDASTLDDL
ncbi:MAG: nucleotidyl transferase AbiEii/AbiGii toxin family protein [Actinomycetaceae bacterium]|nr:nucleotidyl transferase AbiEii/AbiGii toxin family protein [Arcanobacterium sp.]MDD7504549.1 nucleotidyl transferase AbiEii/AbiGii toxin family protein [Actinomycetaceae bacterium]MDY6143192.1 nucleotidyl transferase AbiEii/AbiGii toxin family protein [Arcanobacterium sp.]